MNHADHAEAPNVPGDADMSEPSVLVAIEGAIATIRLNRPQNGNSIDLPVARALLHAVIRCEADPRVRCVVLTGNGRMFSVGGDLGVFTSNREALPELLSELVGTVNMVVMRLLRMPKPLLVLINGPAAGGGFGLALTGDMVLASRSAHFTAAYGTIGLTPDAGLTWLLPRLVGMRKAQEIIMTDRRIPAEEAVDLGLINHAVDADRLAAEGDKIAERFAAGPTRALGTARALLLQSFDGGLETQLERETRGMMAAGTTNDGKEGVSAFLARRAPNFRGD